jgi:hypothetical protein
VKQPGGTKAIGIPSKRSILDVQSALEFTEEIDGLFGSISAILVGVTVKGAIGVGDSDGAI